MREKKEKKKKSDYQKNYERKQVAQIIRDNLKSVATDRTTLSSLSINSLIKRKSYQTSRFKDSDKKCSYR